MSRELFKSSTSDYTAIRKRMEELGLIKPAEGDKNGVDISKPAPVAPNAPIYGHYDG